MLLLSAAIPAPAYNTQTGAPLTTSVGPLFDDQRGVRIPRRPAQVEAPPDHRTEHGMPRVHVVDQSSRDGRVVQHPGQGEAQFYQLADQRIAERPRFDSQTGWAIVRSPETPGARFDSHTGELLPGYHSGQTVFHPTVVRLGAARGGGAWHVMTQCDPNLPSPSRIRPATLARIDNARNIRKDAPSTRTPRGWLLPGRKPLGHWAATTFLHPEVRPLFCTSRVASM